MSKKIKLVQVICFLTIIFAVPLLTLIKPKAESSFFENRTLAKMPQLSISGVMDRSFFSESESYLTDHIVMRDKLLALNTAINMHLLKLPVVNNTVIAGDLLLPYWNFGDDSYDRNDMLKMLDTMKMLKDSAEQNGAELLYVGVPNQSSIMREEYPWYLNNYDAKLRKLKADFAYGLEETGINYLDMTSALENDFRKYYNTTDHHYNLIGAFATYEQSMKGLGLSPLPQSDFEFERVNAAFLGSRNRKIFNMLKGDDCIYSYKTEQSVAYSRWDNGVQTDAPVFDENASTTYSYYMGGDKAETIIKTNRPELPRLLIIGDSFTNALESIMYLSFDEMRSLDFRHYTEMSASEYIAQYKPDYVVYLRDDISYLLMSGNGDLK